MKTRKVLIMSMIIIILIVACRDNKWGNIQALKQQKVAKSDIRITEEKLPKLILAYILKNHSNTIVTKSKIENNGNYELDLDNDLELIFDSQGGFLGVDNDKESTFGDSLLSIKRLPPKITKRINRYYPESSVVRAEKENNGRYEIELNDGTTVAFSDSEDFLGVCKELRYGGEKSMILFNKDNLQIGNTIINPASLPQSILDYLVTHYDSYSIMEVFLEDDGDFEVTLHNGTEVYFSSGGVFLNTGNVYGSDTGDNIGGAIISVDDLPQLVVDYVNISFPEETITQARRRINDRIDIDLSNGFEIYFDPNGSYLSSDENGNGDDHGTEIELETVPQKVQDSLATNYSSKQITKIQLEASGHYKVIFSNEVAIYLDINGNTILPNITKN